MTTTQAPDLFTNVHKGIRQALFAATSALGRAGDDAARLARARALLRQALHFVAHHGENEDVLLLPLLARAAPEVHARMTAAHAALQAPATALQAALDSASGEVLYAQAGHFAACYLEHMHEEEQALEPLIRAALTADELASFGRESVARTAPDDQRLMIGFMLPAMTRVDVEAFLARLPAPLAAELRPLAGD